MNYGSLIDELGTWLGIDTSADSDGRLTLGRCVNWGFRRVWNARLWPERKTVTQIYTMAPYSTGTATLTNLSTAVTGSGTTWTAAMTGAKMARGLSAPYYIFTRTAAGTGTIAPATGYAEATASGVAYVLYQDEYDVGLNVHDIYDATVFRDDRGGAMAKVSQAALDQGRFLHGLTGIPVTYSQVDDRTTGSKRIRIYPIPDMVYRIQVRYFATYSDMVNDGAISPISPDKELLCLKAAALYAQSLSDVRPITSEAEVSQLIEQASRELQDNVPLAYQKSAFDRGAGSGGLWLNSDSLGF